MMMAVSRSSAFQVGDARIPTTTRMETLPRLRTGAAARIAGVGSSVWMVSTEFVPKEEEMELLPKVPQEQTIVLEIPSVVQTSLFQKLYPFLMDHIDKYGHPNIPLGSYQGNLCRKLRRSHTQMKLTEREVHLLQNIGFRFNLMEDVYHEADFTQMLEKLVRYEQKYQTGFQVPKKFEADPELGAWVTGIRRLHNAAANAKKEEEEDNQGRIEIYAKEQQHHPDLGSATAIPDINFHTLDESHVQKLNEIGFAWKSNRKCGSGFMKQYRTLVDRKEIEGLGDILNEVAVQKWVATQRKAQQDGNLSETRTHYLIELFDDENWMK